MARKLLSWRTARFPTARILCPLFSRGRNRFDFLQCSGRERGPALGRTDSRFLSFQLQTSARNHACLPVTRLLRRTERVSPRDRAARVEASSCADSTAAIFYAQGWETDFAKVSCPTSERVPVCH